jgi:hypothetical protein
LQEQTAQKIINFLKKKLISKTHLNDNMDALSSSSDLPEAIEALLNLNDSQNVANTAYLPPPPSLSDFL